MKLRWALIGIVVLAIVLVAAAVVNKKPHRGEYCSVQVDQTHAQLDLEQGQWAALIAARARHRELPPRAATIALAAAFQESKIHNIDYGDRDSLGLFQQRPSQGWGTSAQIMDPHYSIDRFYDALGKISDFESMKITDAAQRVQRSAYPGAYAAHEDYARALASALSGYSPATFSCQINPGATGNARTVVNNLDKAFGARAERVDNSTVRYRLNGTESDRRIRGWAVAQYAVANAKQLALRQVTFDGRSWTATESPEGWQQDAGASDRAVTMSLN